MADLSELLGINTDELDAMARDAVAATRKVVADSAPSEAVVPLVVAAPSGKVGLVNCGNSCYMNAILQMLYHIPEFKGGLMELKANLGEAFEKLGEPFITLFNIFRGLDSAAAAGQTKFNPGELLNLDFECVYNLPEGKTYTPNQYALPSLVNKKFREEGLKRGMFQQENLERFREEAYFHDKKRRDAFLRAKLEANQKAVRGNTPANIEAQKKALKDVKNLAESELEAELETFKDEWQSKKSFRIQVDATEYLGSCILTKIESKYPAILNVFKNFLLSKVTGYYKPENFPNDEMRNNDIIFIDEDFKTTIRKHEGIKDGMVLKYFFDRKDINYIIPTELDSSTISVQLSINKFFSEEDIELYSTRRIEREYIGLNIPKNTSKKLQRSERLSRTKRIIPESVGKQLLLNIPPEQKYILVSLKRFKSDAYQRTSKINNLVRINKEITLENKSIAGNNTITSSNIIMELEGIICHTGSLEGGHYFYYWKDHSTRQWIELNDSTVNELTVIDDPKYLRLRDTPVEKLAYVLLYKRKDGGPTPIPNGYVDYEFPVEGAAEGTSFSNYNMARAIEESLKVSSKEAAPKETAPNESIFMNNSRAVRLAENQSKKLFIEERMAESEELKKTITEARAAGLSDEDIYRVLTDTTEENSNTNTSIDNYIEFFKEDSISLNEILKLENDILFEIAKKLGPRDTSAKTTELRNPILKKLRNSDKETGTTYIYELSQAWTNGKTSGKAFFIPTRKGFPKRIPNYNEAAYQANKERYDRKTRGAKGGKKALRRKTRKLKKSKV